MPALIDINQMDHVTFTHTLGAIFEDTPAIAHQAWHQRPFTSVAHLHQVMVDIVQSLLPAEKLALIKAHPDLGSRAKMADASVQEQASVGLNQLSPPEYDEIQQLNHAYREQFGIPFIIAVKNHTKDSIFAAFRERLTNDERTELNRALEEIGAIARLRLDDLIE